MFSAGPRHVAVARPPTDRVFATVALLLQSRAQVGLRGTPDLYACEAHPKFFDSGISGIIP